MISDFGVSIEFILIFFVGVLFGHYIWKQKNSVGFEKNV